jgi:hypothetical protein
LPDSDTLFRMRQQRASELVPIARKEESSFLKKRSKKLLLFGVWGHNAEFSQEFTDYLAFHDGGCAADGGGGAGRCRRGAGHRCAPARRTGHAGGRHSGG